MDFPWFFIDRPGATAFAVTGDVDLDLDVDIIDASLLAYAFDSRVGDPLWKPSADFNQNGAVDINDAAGLAFWFGWHA